MGSPDENLLFKCHYSKYKWKNFVSISLIDFEMLKRLFQLKNQQQLVSGAEYIQGWC